MPPTDYKLFKLKLPIALYEEFFSFFPGTGQRQQILELLVSLLVEEAGKDRERYRELVHRLLEEA